MPGVPPPTREMALAVTRCAPLRPLDSATGGSACLIHIYPSGPSMGRRYELTDASVLIGRGFDCAVYADDNSVSRKHAHIHATAEGHVAEDLGSTNGTLVNNRRIKRQLLRDGDYLRVGNCIYRYLAGGNVEAEYHEEIYRLAIVDGLTGVPNKRYLMEFLGREICRSVRHGRPLALLMLDIDHFKRINDTWGHLCGDQILREMIGLLRPHIRAEELLARYGGEEFAAVLPEAPLEVARKVGERFRALAQQREFFFEGQLVPVTISVGAASLPGGVDITAEDFIDQADQKLYKAKRAGRNRVCA